MVITARSTDLKPGYKQTEVGIIPEDWSVKTIGELCNFSNGYGFRPADWSKDGLPIIRIQNLNGSKEFNYFNGTPDPSWLVDPGTILFAWAGTRGVSFGPKIWNGPKGVLNQHIYRIHPHKDVNPLWLYKVLEIVTANIEQKAHGFKATLLHVRKEEITSQVVYCPPPQEQQKIVTALLNLDLLLETLDKLIAKKRAIKQATMQQLLTGKTRLPGFGKGVKQDYKQTEVGVIPDDWVVTNLGEVADVKTGPFGSALHEKDYVSDGTPIITVEHLGEQGVVHMNLPMVSDLDRKRLNAYSLSKGDIVFSRVGSVDRNSLVKEEESGWLFSGRLLRIRLKVSDVDTAFLSYYFHQESTKQRIRSVAVGQTMPSLNTQILKNISIAFPPTKAEQAVIATVLSDMDAEIAALEQKRDKTRALKQGMMQELLTGKTRLVS